MATIRKPFLKIREDLLLPRSSYTPVVVRITLLTKFNIVKMKNDVSTIFLEGALRRKL